MDVLDDAANMRYLGKHNDLEILIDYKRRGDRIYLTHTVLNGHYVLRLCVGQAHSEARHVEQAWRLIQQKAAELDIE